MKNKKIITTATLDNNNSKIWYRNQNGMRSSNVIFEYTSEELSEIKKCQDDPIYFFETYCKYMTIEGFKNIVLRDYQKDIIRKYFENKFTINMCSRQIGITMVLSMITLYEAMFSIVKSIALVCPNIKDKEEHMDKIKKMYINLPYFLKRGVVYWKINNVLFDNLTSLNCHSSFSTIGYTMHRIIIDNFAFFKNKENFMNTVLPLVITNRYAKISISSVKDMDYFDKLFEDAEREEGDLLKNVFEPTRVYWWAVPQRDDYWKQLIVKNIGQESFDKEFDLKFKTL